MKKSEWQKLEYICFEMIYVAILTVNKHTSSTLKMQMLHMLNVIYSNICQSKF